MQLAEAYPQSFWFSGSGMGSKNLHVWQVLWWDWFCWSGVHALTTRGQFDPGNKSFRGQWLAQERPRDSILTNECWEEVCWRTSRKDIRGPFLPLDVVLRIRCLEPPQPSGSPEGSQPGAMANILGKAEQGEREAGSLWHFWSAGSSLLPAPPPLLPLQRQQTPYR